MKEGKLYSWHANGFGVVAVSVKERFFLHVSNIVEIPDDLASPPIGSTVQFDVAEAKNGGKLPQAVNARVIPPTQSGAL
jgi:hypothetical protein